MISYYEGSNRVRFAWRYLLTIAVLGVAASATDLEYFKHGLLGVLCYAALAISVRKVFRRSGFVRQFVDSAYICFVGNLPGANPFLVACLVGIPLVNSFNYGVGKSMGKTVRFSLMWIGLIASIYREYHWYWVLGSLGIVHLLIFDSLYLKSLSARARRLESSIYDEIRKNIDGKGGPNLALKSLKEKIKKDFGVLTRVSSIFCFEHREDRLVLRYSSDAFVSADITNKRDVLRVIEHSTSVGEVQFLWDGRKFEERNARGLYLVSGGRKMVFVFLAEKPFTMGATDILQEACRSALSFFAAMVNHNDQKHEMQRQLNNNAVFIEGAQEVLHFTKNKVTPLRALVAIGESLIKARRENIGSQVEFKHLPDAIRQADANIDLILNYATNILNAEFEFRHDESAEMTFGEIYDLIFKFWTSHFAHSKIRIRDGKIERTKECFLKRTTLESLVSNMISNMDKHGVGGEFCSVGFSDKEISIEFRNRATETKCRNLFAYKAYLTGPASRMPRLNTYGVHAINRAISLLGADLAMELDGEKNDIKTVVVRVKINIEAYEKDKNN